LKTPPRQLRAGGRVVAAGDVLLAPAVTRRCRDHDPQGAGTTHPLLTPLGLANGHLISQTTTRTPSRARASRDRLGVRPVGMSFEDVGTIHLTPGSSVSVTAKVISADDQEPPEG
jgi:hypothetical protein